MQLAQLAAPEAECVPAEQAVQLVAPAEGEYVLGAQDEHFDAPAAE